MKSNILGHLSVEIMFLLLLVDIVENRALNLLSILLNYILKCSFDLRWLGYSIALLLL